MSETMADRQRLPASGPQRERLRQKGQFWTPDWSAEAMVAYVTAGDTDAIFDPAVGAGAFFQAAQAIAAETGKTLTLSGTELDPKALDKARQSGLAADDLACVEIRDFVLQPPPGPFAAIVANPPYIRHHRLTPDTKAQLRALAVDLLGRPIDGRAGLHIYFLLRALQLLASNGRLAFIMPADTCEGVFAGPLWQWITRRYRLEAVITFAPEASPFPDVDTNPIIFMIRNAPPEDEFLWARLHQPGTALKAWIQAGFVLPFSNEVEVLRRQVQEGLTTGLSRSPGEPMGGPVLGDFASVMRGIATGANDFFFLTAQQVAWLGIPDEFLRPAVGQTRDVPDEELTQAHLERLEAKGRPTLLFCPDDRPLDAFPEDVAAYLRQGEARGLPERALISTRNPWYKMETRPVPPILFAYLGRRNTRFIRNTAGATPLTSFLCVYPHREDAAFVDQLWQVLRHPKTVENLALVGKSYGSGAIKIEPRALEKRPLPAWLVTEMGLAQAQPQPLQLLLL